MTLVEKQRQSALKIVEAYYREQYSPHVCLLPNGRFGLYAVAKSCLARGDQVIISPITCHTVILALLNAGVQPAFANISLSDGNIDPSLLDPGQLRRAKAIITTNLYGNPDDAIQLLKLAKKYGLLMIEDCAHILQSSIEGKRIGSIGDVSIFSFKKYFDEPGGMFVCGQSALFEKVTAVVKSESILPGSRDEVHQYCKYKLRTGILKPFTELVILFRKNGQPTRSATDGETHSGEMEMAKLVPAHTFNQMPTADCLIRVAYQISRIEDFIIDWKKRNEVLIASVPFEVKTSAIADSACNLVVPFFARQRDKLVAEYQSAGVPVWFKYNPSMNKVFAKVIPAGSELNLERINHWTDMILPLSGKYHAKIKEINQELPANMFLKAH